MALTEKVKIVVDVVAGKAKQELDSLGRASKDAQGGLDKLKSKGGEVTDFITTNFMAMGAAATTAVAAFAVKSINAFQDLALSSGKFADSTGATVEEASRLIEVFGDMGVEASTVQGAINKMNVVIGKGGEEIEALGLKGANTQETFLNVVNYLNSIEDPTKRAAAGTKLLGKGWTELSESVALGADELKASLEGVSDAKVIDKQELANARSFRDSMDDLNDVVENFTLTVGGTLVPALNGLLAKVQEIKDAIPSIPEPPGGWLDWTSALPGIGSLTTPINMAGDALQYFKGEGEKAADASDDLGQSSEDLAAAQEASQAAAEEQAQAIEDGTKKLQDQRAAAEELEAGMRELVDAQLAAGSATFAAADAFDSLLSNMDEAKTTTDDAKTSVNEKEAADRKAFDSVLKYAASETKAAEETAKANGQQFTAKEAAAAQVAALERVKAKFPELGPIIDTYIAKAQTAANPITTPFTAKPDYKSLDSAHAAMQASAERLPPITTGLRVRAAGGQVITTGGSMSGGTVDETGYRVVGEQGRETVWINKGEYVANHANTEAMGKNGKHETRNYNITVNVAAGAQPADVGRQLVNAITAFERANGAGWRGN